MSFRNFVVKSVLPARTSGQYLFRTLIIGLNWLWLREYTGKGQENLDTVISTALEAIRGWGVNAFRSRYKAHMEAKEIAGRLESYLSRKMGENFFASREEEIDFGGLAEYVKGEMIDDVSTSLFGDREQRKKARKKILEKASSYAQKNSTISQERAIKLVSASIDILTDFFRNNIPRELRQTAGEITDDVCKHMDEKAREITDRISKAGIMSIDNSVQLMRRGKFGELEENFGIVLDSLSAQHELAPWYGVEPRTIGKECRLISVPKLPEAYKKYPPIMKGIAKFEIDGTEREFSVPDIFEYANRHQMKITMTIQEAEKYLGPRRDPFQAEAEQEIGKKYVIQPKPFPPAFPCKIIGDGKVVVDYLLLRTVEVLDDGTYIVTNDEQGNRLFKVVVRINPEKNVFDIQFVGEGFGNQGRLEALKTLKLLAPCSYVALHSYELNGVLASGTYKDSCCTMFGSIDDDIRFYERIIAVEKYFGNQLNVPNIFNQEQVECLEYISELIDGGICEIQRELDSFTCEFVISEKLKCDFQDIAERERSLGVLYNAKICLWETEFRIPIIRTLSGVVVDEYDKVLKKIEVLDIGDVIKIKFIPGEHGVTIQDRLAPSGIA